MATRAGGVKQRPSAADRSQVGRVALGKTLACRALARRPLAGIRFAAMRLLRPILALALLATGCKPKPATLEVLPKELRFTSTGDAQVLKVRVLDKEGNPVEHKPCVFLSTSTSAADVRQDGTVIANGSGSTDVRVSCAGMVVTVPTKVTLPATLKLDPKCQVRCKLMSNGDEPIFKLEGFGASAALNGKVLDASQQPMGLEIKYEASDPDFRSGSRPVGISLSKDGVITATGKGRFFVLAQSGPALAKATVEVDLPEVRLIRAPATVVLKPGEQAPLKVQLFRDNKGRAPVEGAQITYKSSDEAVVKVADDGMLTAGKEGSSELLVASDQAFTQVQVVVNSRAAPPPKAPKAVAKPTGKKGKKRP